jgi:ubiquitin carboxyl-terminal hydrolase 34
MSLEEVPDDPPSGMLQSLSLLNGPGISSNPIPLESDVGSVEEWDANSAIASDSEMGLAGSP